MNEKREQCCRDNLVGDDLAIFVRGSRGEIVD